MVVNDKGRRSPGRRTTGLYKYDCATFRNEKTHSSVWALFAPVYDAV